MKVIKIGAEWCNGCVVMRPRWKKIEAENPWLKTEYIDYDKDNEKALTYGLDENKLPTFIFIAEDGTELDRAHGELTEKAITEKIYAYKEK